MIKALTAAVTDKQMGRVYYRQVGSQVRQLGTFFPLAISLCSSSFQLSWIESPSLDLMPLVRLIDRPVCCALLDSVSLSVHCQGCKGVRGMPA